MIRYVTMAHHYYKDNKLQYYSCKIDMLKQSLSSIYREL